MALRDQPYIPLYIQDFMTDEKLLECSAQSVGVYIMIMCVMHKSNEYGVILLKQKDKQTTNQIKNFACKLAKHLPYGETIVEESITELVSEDVLQLEGDSLSQKRMIKDNKLSIARSKAGSMGGKSTQKKPFAKAKSKAKSKANKQAKAQANTEYENEYEIESENVNKNEYENFVSAWFDFFENKGLPKPGFDGTQGKALKEIIKKLDSSSKEGTNPIDSFNYILSRWDTQGDWIKDNALDLKIFNSKFNVIINTLKNGKHRLTEEQRISLANNTNI